MDVYANCPEIANDHYLLRLISEDDCADLLKVYSDQKAVPLFNSDNCKGDDFHYTTSERMMEAIRFWIMSYQHKYFVRWSIVDRRTDEAVGTIELFHRDPDNGFVEAGLLRLDLRSDYETEEAIEEIIGLLAEPAYELFECEFIATKAVPQAEKRRSVLQKMGFVPSFAPLVGDDGTAYDLYYVMHKSCIAIR